MVNFKTEIKTNLRLVNSHLKELQRLFQSISSNDRINRTLNDIETTIKNCQYYLNEDQLWDVNSFRFDNNLVSLVDSIQYNDYGVFWDYTKEAQKKENCEEILKIVSVLNALTLDEKKRNNT